MLALKEMGVKSDSLFLDSAAGEWKEKPAQGAFHTTGLSKGREEAEAGAPRGPVFQG